ncbi:peptidase M24, structural domain-containing protein [Phlyctochytrium arcticum]|nr:peptidase M24, structural domain-containing protein [Phlyctochytrium arcticum]
MTAVDHIPGWLCHSTEILHSPPRLPVPAHIPRPEYDEVTGAPLVTLTKPSIKKDVERDVMRDAGRAAKLVLQAACQAVRPGITTAQIDAIAHAECIRLGAYPSPLGYNGYPKSICTSINNVICHGNSRPLLPTDILNIDVTIYINGFHADTSRTVSPDPASLDQQGQHLLDTTLKCLDAGISVCGPGVPFDRIGEIIQALARDEGFSISEDFCGHGIGRHFHEPPLIHHTSTHSTSGHMFPGMTFTIEPVLCQGMAGFVMWPDSWTAVTMDGGRSAQFEHTLLITESGVEVLTA